MRARRNLMLLVPCCFMYNVFSDDIHSSRRDHSIDDIVTNFNFTQLELPHKATVGSRSLATLHTSTSFESRSIDQRHSPSVSPTSFPTDISINVPELNCYDSTTYRNPLNTLLKCEHHKNTSCEMWKGLGLNDTEVELLLTSCPISCNQPCR